MKRIAFIAIGIMVIGTAQLSAQVDVAYQFGIGIDNGFVASASRAGFNFNLDFLIGARIEDWNTSILAGVRYNFDRCLDTGAQVEYYFGDIWNSGLGISLAGGVQIQLGEDVVPYIRAGGFWHFFSRMLKVGFELDYRFSGQITAGIILSMSMSFSDPIFMERSLFRY